MRGTRVEELLAFDLALGCGKIPETDEAARPADAPALFPNACGDAEGATRAPLTNAREGTEAVPRALRLIGFDEAGRGALAGPIVVGCVHIPPELLTDREAVLRLLPGVDDSKALSPKARDAAFVCVAASTRWAFGCASAAEIDAIGIVPAAERAARRAYRRLSVSCDLMVFDRGLSLGEPVPLDDESVVRSPRSDRARVPLSVAFTRGDTRSLHVAAASLVAKVTRDRIMQRLDRSFPGFDLGKHKGYGTQRHFRALAEREPSPIHRRTFLRGLEKARSQSC